jgi:hypothetical protein
MWGDAAPVMLSSCLMGQRAVVMGDVATHPAQLTEIDWGHIFEMDQALAAQTRRQFLD